MYTFSFFKNRSASKRDRDALVQALSKSLIDDALSLADLAYELANEINQRLWKDGHKTNEPESNKEAIVITAAIDYWIFNFYNLRKLMVQVEKNNGLKYSEKKRLSIYREIINFGVEFFAKKMSEVSGEQVSLWSKVIQEKNNSKQEIFQDMPLVCKPEDNAKTSSALNWTMSDVAKTLDCERTVLFWLPIKKSALEGLIALNKSRSDMLLPLLQ